jgi:transcriptional regulator with XRE-family HTH domain
MKERVTGNIHQSVENLIKIMNDRKLTKSAFAELIGMPEAKWNKISNGRQNLSVDELSKIAENLKIRDIDILTYPKKFVEAEIMEYSDVRVQLNIELKEVLKDKVLSLIFGNSNLRILK